MDLNRIAAFVEVIESGGFSAAARVLGVPKSSVSRAVAALERSLGVQLLQRTTRTLHLTDAGRPYFETAKGVLAELDEATARVTRLGVEPRGLVRVTVPPDLGGSIIAEIVSDYVRGHREVRVDVQVSSRRVNLIEEGFDLAVRAGALEDSSLVARKVGTTDVALYAARSYLERHGTPKTLAALAGHDCVLYREPSGRSRWALTGPSGKKERVTVSGRLSADDLPFVVAAVRAGAGIGLLPAVHGEDALERVLPGYALRGTPLHVVAPSGRHPSAAVLSFRDFLVARLTDEAWRCPEKRDRRARDG